MTFSWKFEKIEVALLYKSVFPQKYFFLSFTLRIYGNTNLQTSKQKNKRTSITKRSETKGLLSVSTFQKVHFRQEVNQVNFSTKFHPDRSVEEM